MPPLQFWFTGSAIGALIALVVSSTTLTWAWYNAARTEQKATQSNETSEREKKRLREVREELQKFYVEGLSIQETNIPKDAPDAQAKQFNAQADEWLNRTNAWIFKTLGPAASARFLDRSGNMARTMTGDVHPLAGTVKISVSDFRQNLAKLIEINAWDAGEPKS
jgi:hypothetical protein